MKRALAALLSGLLFGAGLHVSGMTSTRNVRAFLDLFGDWDPRLMVVMAAALAVVVPGEYLLRKKRKPLLADDYELPAQTRIDAQLLVGAACFGVGWGLVGLCPGPMFVVLGSFSGEVWMFAATFVAGMAIAERVIQRASAA